MTRLSALLVVAALPMLAGSCVGGSSATPATSGSAGHSSLAPHRPPYARLRVNGRYASSTETDHFGGDLQRFAFTLACPAPRVLLEPAGDPTWRSRLCRAVLDYARARHATPSFPAPCACPLTAIEVHVDGHIHGRSFNEIFTPCLCGESARMRRDVLTILRQHPQPLVSGP